MSTTTLTYRIDSAGHIVSIEGPWDAFAEENDAPALAARVVLGRPLFDFIAGVDVRHIYDLLIRRVRSGRTIEVPFRCDAPAARRWLRLSMAPAGDLIEFRSSTLDVRSRPPQALLASARRRSAELLLICSWCKQVELREGWREIEEAVQTLALLDGAAMPGLTHGLCPACAQRVTREWLAELEQTGKGPHADGD